MRYLKSIGLVFALFSAFLLAVAPFGAAAAPASAAQTYQVTVGYENASTGAMIQSYFPDIITIHAGDTVHWVQATHEIHTVTFLSGQPLPELLIPAPAGSPSPLMFNPVAAAPANRPDKMFDGTWYANSGIMGLDPGQATSFDLTFTKPGTYTYICLVHGVVMSGEVVVVGPDTWVPSPAQTSMMAQWQLSAQKPGLDDAFRQAAATVPAPTHNADGTTTYHVMMGYSSGPYDLMRFFPSNLNVRQGDTVVWSYGMAMSGMSIAPHTVTFLNGTPDPSLTLPNSLFVNPQMLLPSVATNPAQAGQPLTRNGFYHSGLLMPGQQFSLKIGAIRGPINYQCLLHDESGMVATLTVIGR